MDRTVNGPDRSDPVRYVASRKWDDADPRTLVVACSDGRIQDATDRFLADHLGVSHYDRMIVPGGAGALVRGGVEFSRANRMRKECSFLITAHGVERVILTFHCAAPGGPESAICGDYRRRFPSKSLAEIDRQQVADAAELVRVGLNGLPLEIYRCEVTADGVLRFVDFHP